MCRKRGFSAISSVTRAVKSNSLREYIVWLPMLKSDNRDAAVEASAEFEDSRIRYMWDEDKIIGEKFSQTLKLDRTAWDVYLLYNKGSVWKKDEPTVPDFWMHQLGGLEDIAPTLDSVVLRWKVEEAIASK